MAKKALALAQEVLDHFSNPDTYIRGAVNWALIYEGKEFKDVKLNEGQACFGGLFDQNGGVKYFVFWNFGGRVFNQNEERQELKKHEKDYIRYIVKDSVFAPCFHTKSVNKIFKSGVIMKTEMPAQFIYCAATSIRYVTEYPDIVEMWSRFRKHIGDDAALIMAHLFTPTMAKPELYQSNSFWSSQHKWPVGSSSFGKDEFKRFLDRDLSGMDGLPSFADHTNFRGVTKIWRESASIKKGGLDNIPDNKKFKWAGGVKKIESNWSNLSYFIYENKDMAKDMRAMVEANLIR